MKISIAFQPALRPVLPQVIAGADYQEERKLFERIDLILTQGDLDSVFFAMAVEHQKIDLQTLPPQDRAKFAQWCFVALRACITRVLTGLSLREFATRLADSALLQWFLHLASVDKIKVFSKSTAQRLEKFVSPEQLRDLNSLLLKKGIAPVVGPPSPCANQAAIPVPTCVETAAKLDGPTQSAAEQTTGCEVAEVAKVAETSSNMATGPATNEVKTQPKPPFGLAEFLNLEDAWIDTTAVLANIHHPTDWVLLRDANRTLMLGTLCIRNAGVLHRMPKSPEDFLSGMNGQCMAMAAQRRQKGAKKARKAILRKMKNLLNVAVGHAQNHIKALKERRETHTLLSEGQAAQIIARMEKVIEQVPAIKQQAHDRIIGGKKLAANEKILSIYDENINIIIRGKANAEVEFGNRLDLVESRQGLILDAYLHKDNPADSNIVVPCVKRMKEGELPVKKLGGDRGLYSGANEKALEGMDIQSYICPRDPKELSRRLEEEPGFKEYLKRRGGIEARVGIFKNDMLGNPASGRSYESRKQGVGWAVLAHNLWVIARLPQKETPVQAQEPEDDELAFLGPPPPESAAAA
jgi:hypothetical protein